MKDDRFDKKAQVERDRLRDDDIRKEKEEDAERDKREK